MNLCSKIKSTGLLHEADFSNTILLELMRDVHFADPRVPGLSLWIEKANDLYHCFHTQINDKN